MVDDIELILTLLLCLICAGIFIVFVGLVVFLLIRSNQSRIRFANYLENMNRDEQIQFAKKSLGFNSILLSGVALGILALLISLVVKQESLAQNICFGLFIYVLIMVLISMFVYRVPKGK